MNIPISTPTSILVPPEKPPIDSGLSSFGLGTVQALLTASQEMLLKASENLLHSMKMDKRLEQGLAGASAPHPPSKPHSTNDGTPNSTEIAAQVYSLFCQINNAYLAYAAGKMSSLVFSMLMNSVPSPGLYPKGGFIQQLQTILGQVTDAALKGHINDVLTQLTQGKPQPYPVPSPGVWSTWWKASNLETTIGKWLGNDDNDHAMDQLITPDDQINILQIMSCLGQDTSMSIQNKTVDDLFWARNPDIFQTVAAYYLQQSGGDWFNAKIEISMFLQALPPADPKNNPNYAKFTQGLKDTQSQGAWPYPIPADAILSDGFGFIDAWGQFRNGTPVIDPNHIKYGS